MKRNAIQIFALIGAISAGGVAHADNGFKTGHHKFQAQSAGTNSGVMMKSSVGHNGAFLDGAVSPGNADIHPRRSQNRDMMMERGMESSGPLPPEAGNER
ncbi:hypothetical protein [Roseovarius sp. Pro17]|uniref:hypothetical protein n=1 Tax=Roseovarius sp. Pro17 TaxID=3108175 RepID=UPI002D76C5CB|nr:hypothetical protein [Roseovarius sp. Pro17]